MGKPLIAGVGFATIGELPDLSGLDRALGRIEDLGASHVELAFFAADLISGGRVLPEPRRRLESSCRRRKLGYTAHGTLAVNLMDEANLDLHKAVCRANLELAAAVGATVLVHHPGTVPAWPPHELDRLHAIEQAALREMGDVAARLGVRLAVETLFVEAEQEYTADPVRLAAELRAVDHPHVVGTLDVSHSYLMTSFRGTSFTEAIAAFAPVTGHFHLHDSFGRPPGTLKGFYTDSERVAFGVGDLHLPFGWGDIPFETLLPGLPVLPGTLLTVELPERHWAELERCAAFARELMDRMNGAARC
jgi:sugar phosphate isomerase/epimerase